MLALGGCSSVGRLEVAQVGSFHVGGRPVTLSGLPQRELVPTPGAPAIKVDPNGDFEVEAMYVRYTRLLQPRAAYPLLLWHGGGLTGVSFETKPDGQPGWEDFFLKAGHSVYVSDSVERGRASWARYPEIFKTEPFFRSKKEAWELFRIGAAGSYATDPSRRQALPGSQFPVGSFDQFMKQGVPRWSTNDAATQAAYNEYVSKVCPCVILVHSQGANFAYEAALAYPNKVKALVLVEPTGSPDPAKTDFAKLRNTPMLWVWADNTEKYALWQTLVARQEKFREGVKAAGGVADLVQLPAVGIRGNSHMMMMDRNSDAIAQLIQGWIDKHGLMR
ncbi:esterase [Variovorax paradoxus]|nr:esterase [Variovorax paradoxus]